MLPLERPVNFCIGELQNKPGNPGVTGSVEFIEGTGLFADDTLLTPFTAKGMLRDRNRTMLKGIGRSGSPRWSPVAPRKAGSGVKRW
jgi:hypothetical protein